MKVEIKHNLSPIKFCIFIKPNSKVKLIEAIKSLFSIWCGIYSPIIPFYSTLTEKIKRRYSINVKRDEYYINTISNYDPDIIVYDDYLDIAKIKSISGDREVISLSSFMRDLRIGKPSYSYSIDRVINHIIEKNFKYKRNDNYKLKLPRLKTKNLFLGAWQGLLMDNVEDKYVQKHLLKNEFVEQVILDNDNIFSYLEGSDISLLDSNTLKANFYHKNEWEVKFIIYFLDIVSTLDILDFWNLRALGWIVIPIPYLQFEKDSYQSLLKKSLKIASKRSTGIADVFIAEGINKESIFSSLSNLIKKEKINVRLAQEEIFPRYWSRSRDVLNADKAVCPKIMFENTQEEVEVEENEYVSFNLPKPPFETHYSTKLYYKNYLRFGYYYSNNQGDFAEVIHAITTEDWRRIIHHTGSGNEWRLSRDGIIRYTRFDFDRAFLYLPKSFKFFSKYFKRLGFSIEETASGKLGKEVLKNIGGIHGINIFSSSKAIQLIQLFEGGKVINLQQLIGTIKRLNPFPEFTDNHVGLIDLLLKKQIIEFGIQIQCLTCEQRSFYLINTLDNVLKCPICRNDFELPKSDPRNSLKFVYRGVGPFSRNNKVDGLLSVLLTIRLFKTSISNGFNRNMSYIFDFNIKKDNNLYELDLAILADGKQNKDFISSLICECKTFNNLEQIDIDRLKYIGNEIPNTVLVVATLKNEFTEDEKIMLSNLTNHFRTKEGTTSNPVLLLTGNELISDNVYFPLEKYESNIAKHQYVNYISTLADLTCKEHLGLKTCDEIFNELWVKAHQTREKNE